MNGPAVSEATKRYLMARQMVQLAEYDVEGEQEHNVDRLVDLLHNHYPAYSIDELLLRPREALRFCDIARQMFKAYDLPDDVILRPILGRRKHG